jgi:iron complex transport system ATP-binding protein
VYQARGIRVVARGRAILDDADLSVVPGKVTALVGPNGAGKSTLLKVLAGERRFAAGEVTLDGTPLSQLTPAALARRRAVLPQVATVAFPFTVAEVVSLGLPPSYRRAEAAALVAQALAAVEIRDFGPRLFDELSGGERQRVQLARVLAQAWTAERGYLLLDEPTLSLDLSHQLLVLKLARAHAAEGGGVLVVLHDLNLAAIAADEIVALKAGRVVSTGTPSAIMTDALIAELYGVRATVRGVPEGPFLLPQTAL